MTERGRVLENHSLLVRDGRILDLCPSADAAERYAATVVLQRPSHLVMPGMINADTHAALSLFRAMDPDLAPTAWFDARNPCIDERMLGPEFVRDGVLASIAEMLQSGITCFADRYYFPGETARAANEQGMRAVIGMPVAETASLWAKGAADYLTKSLALHDEYRGHALIRTAFAPHGSNSVSDATFARIATLADELDMGITIDLHESAAEIAESTARHGMRPMQRLWDLGLLTPALNAVHMGHATAAEIELAQRSGIAITLCPQANLKAGAGLPPARSFTASGIRLALGSGAAQQNQDIWSEMKLLALMSHACNADGARLSAWDALAVATRGGAEVLGLEARVGSLAAGKWADLCCVDLGGPATQPMGDPVTQLVFGGGRDLVSDVWVAGRHLLSDGEMTRLDWAGVAARANAWAARLQTGG